MSASGEKTLAQSSERVLRGERPSGELGPEEAKEFRDTGKYGGKEHAQKGAECAERSSQIHVLVVSAENGGKQLGQPRIPAVFQGSFRNTGPGEFYVALRDEAVDVWRPVEAVSEGGSIYRITDAPASHHEAGEFPPGSRVRCERRDLGE